MDTPIAPPVSPELVKWLVDLFPDRLPTDVNVPLDEVRTLQGEQRVIRKLKDVMRTQREDALSGAKDI